MLHVCSTSLLKTLWEKEKLLVTSNFSFSHSVSYPFGELSAIFIILKFSSANSFSLEESKICRWESVKKKTAYLWMYKKIIEQVKMVCWKSPGMSRCKTACFTVFYKPSVWGSQSVLERNTTWTYQTLPLWNRLLQTSYTVWDIQTYCTTNSF